jgi:hypothetical protein
MEFNANDFLKRRRAKLCDRTQLFLDMCKRLNKIPSIVMMNIGGRGSGKTAQIFKIITIFLDSLGNSCGIVFYNAPTTFIEKIKKYSPGKFSDHVMSINRMRQLTEIKQKYKYILLCFDEGMRDLNAKDALKKSSRRLEKMVAISRQQDIFLIYNTQIQNINKTMRSMTDMRFYKGNTKPAVTESDDKFAQDHLKYIKKLYNDDLKKFAAFESEYSHFKDGKNDIIDSGVLELDLFKYVPWWNDEISRAYEDVNLDAEFDEFEEEYVLIEQCADLLENEIPRKQLEKLTSGAIRGYLNRNHRELYYDVSNYINRVVDEIKARNLEFDILNLADNDEAPGAAPDLKFEKWDFATFLKENFKDIDKDTADIYYYWAMGMSNRQIYPCVPNMTDYRVNEILKEFRQRGKNKNENRAGFLFEKWAAFEYDESRGKIGGQTSECDYIAADQEIFTFKCYDDVKKSKNFSQSVDFSPEFKEAKRLGKKYWAVFYDPKWPSFLRVLHLDPVNDPDNVDFFKEGHLDQVLDFGKIREIVENEKLKEVKKDG